MQYFKEYINESILINNSEIVLRQYNIEDTLNNRAIIGDTVYMLDNKVVGIKNRSDVNIIGILYLDSKIKYGNIKDKLLYLFKPTNKQYPNFYVPYKTANNFNKVYSIIQFKSWDVTNKLPIGTLIETVGNIGDKDAECEHLRFFYGIRNNTWKITNNKKNDDLLILENLKDKDENYEVFSIDPCGSKDIDDAFHYKKISENSYEVGIHIASPTQFFNNDLCQILDRVSTIYLPDKKYNMLPNIYADNMISLLEGEKRFALSLIIIFDNNFNIISENIEETVVKNIKNFTYEQFDKNYNSSKNLSEFVDFSDTLFNEKLDSHKLVEKWMIFTNKKIASILINRGYSNIILRKHQGIEEEKEEINLPEILIKYLGYKKEKSALYEIYDEDKNQVHSKLGKEHYTHFTSPIRRSIDFYIHYLIVNSNKSSNSNKIFKKDELEIVVNNINSFTKNARKFDRSVKRLDFLYNVKNQDLEKETYGYIINITANRLTIYIPEYNLEEKITIIPKKFEKIYDIKLQYSKKIINENEHDNNIIDKIDYTIDEIQYSYELYQKLDIKLWVFTSSENIFDKLKIEIMT